MLEYCCKVFFVNLLNILISLNRNIGRKCTPLKLILNFIECTFTQKFVRSQKYQTKFLLYLTPMFGQMFPFPRRWQVLMFSFHSRCKKIDYYVVGSDPNSAQRLIQQKFRFLNSFLFRLVFHSFTLFLIKYVFFLKVLFIFVESINKRTFNISLECLNQTFWWNDIIVTQRLLP